MRSWVLRCLEWLVGAAALVGGAWLALRFVLPGLAPFLLAYLLAALTEPAVRALERLHFSRTAAAALVTLALLALRGLTLPDQIFTVDAAESAQALTTGVGNSDMDEME